MIKPYFSFLSISGLLMLSVLAVVTTMTTQQQAYAQGRGPCPEGFTLNRGVCQAEPELTCEPYGEGFELTDVENFGMICYDVETAEPACIPPFPSSAINYWDALIDLRCESGQYPHGVASNITPTCTHLEGPGWTFASGSEGCKRELRETPVQQCDIGVLNEESGFCEVKPGRGSAAGGGR